MQVFIPYADPKEVAKCLDISRLNKQILEAKWILASIRLYHEDGDLRHLKHPVMRMYKDHYEWLKYYKEVLRRYKLLFREGCWDGLEEPKEKPDFLSYQPLLDCHRKRLYQKGIVDMKRRVRLTENPYKVFEKYASDNEENMYIIDNKVLIYLNGKLIRTHDLALNKKLISDLISALNGGSEDIQDADNIYRKILDTKDSSLIESANFIRSIL